MHIKNSTDVVIFGAGPAGLITACTIKAHLNDNIKICVVDYMEEPTRQYELAISEKAINVVLDVLNKSKTSQEHSSSENTMAFRFKQNLIEWKNTTQPIKYIESQLSYYAEALGVEIIRDNKYRDLLTAENIKKMLGSEPVQNLELLHTHLKDCQVILGTDGAHSDVRQAVMGSDEESLCEVRNLHYLIEIKFDVTTATKPRNSYESAIQSSANELGIETMGRGKPNESHKPAALHYFVNKKIFEAFVETSRQSWSLQKIEEQAKRNRIVELELLKIRDYIKQYDGNYKPETVSIKCLPVSIYRSRYAAKLVEKKIVAIAGDAYSGAVLQEGFNKAAQEAAYLGYAVSQFFQEKSSVDNDSLPKEFIEYQERVEEIFYTTKKNTVFEIFGINMMRDHLQNVSPLKLIRWAEQTPCARTAIKTLFAAAICIAVAGLILHFTLGMRKVEFLWNWSVDDLLVRIGLPVSFSTILLSALAVKATQKKQRILL